MIPDPVVACSIRAALYSFALDAGLSPCNGISTMANFTAAIGGAGRRVLALAPLRCRNVATRPNARLNAQCVAIAADLTSEPPLQPCPLIPPFLPPSHAPALAFSPHLAHMAAGLAWSKQASKHTQVDKVNKQGSGPWFILAMCCCLFSERLTGPTGDASKTRKCYSLVSYVLTALHGPPNFANVHSLSLLLARTNPVAIAGSHAK